MSGVLVEYRDLDEYQIYLEIYLGTLDHTSTRNPDPQDWQLNL